MPKGRLARGLAVLAGGTAIGQLVAVGAQPILSRLFTPEHFGTLSAYAWLLNILCVLPALTYERAIPMPAEDEDAANVLAVAMSLTVVFSLLLSGIVFLFGQAICELLKVPQLAPFIWMMPLGFFAVGTYQNLYYWSIRRKSYKTIAKTKASQAVAGAGIQIALGLLKIAPFGLLLGHLVGQAMGITSFTREIWRNDHQGKPDSPLKAISWTRMKAVAHRYRRYPIFQSWGNLVNALGLNLPGILLQALYGPVVAGSYFLVQKLFGLPLQLVSSSASDVFFGEAAPYATTDPKRMDKLFNRITKKLFITAIGPAVLVALLSGVLFPIVFGEKWVEAGLFAQILSLSFLMNFLFGFTIRFVMVERPDMTLSWSVIRVILVAGSIYAAWNMGWGPLAAVAAISVSLSASYIIKYAMWKMAIRRLEFKVASSQQ